MMPTCWRFALCGAQSRGRWLGAEASRLALVELPQAPGAGDTPPWMDSDGLLAYLLGRTITTAADGRRAFRLHAELVG